MPHPSRSAIAAFGVVQILGWGSSFYFPAVFAPAIVRETAWPLPWVVGGASLGLLVAGLVSPAVGAAIARRGGRAVLASSSVLFAAGLCLVGIAPTLAVYLAGWAVIGIGMGTGLYDAVFAALGRQYGHAARMPIATLTLFGGFASTICWPFSAWLLEWQGWRAACFVYAALHLALALPLMLYATRVRPSAAAPPHDAKDGASPFAPAQAQDRQPIFALLAVIFSLAAGIGAIVIVHMLIFLQARGLDFAAAVAAGMLFGPAQVGARVIERLFGARYHPIWTLAAAVALMALGLVLFTTGMPVILAAIAIYAAGYGISWIARGTVPLALFGPHDYPRLAGRLAFPGLIVQALAPSAGALMLSVYGESATIITLIALALVNAALTLWLLRLARTVGNGDGFRHSGRDRN